MYYYNKVPNVAVNEYFKASNRFDAGTTEWEDSLNLEISRSYTENYFHVYETFDHDLDEAVIIIINYDYNFCVTSVQAEIFKSEKTFNDIVIKHMRKSA